MKKISITLILLITFCITSLAQVGLLSSNNKSESNQYSKQVPSLSFSIAPTNYERLNDSFRIKLNYDTLFHNLLSQPNNGDSKINNLTRKIKLVQAQLDSTLKTNAVILNDLATVTYKNFYDYLSKIESVNRNVSSNLYGNKYKINSYWFLIDSSKEKIDKTKFLDSLTMVYQQVNLESDDNSDLKKRIREERQKLDDYKDTLQFVKLSSSSDYDKIKNKWMEFASDTLKLGKQQKNINDSSESTVHFYEAIIRNNIKNKTLQKDVENKEFGAFPQLTNILGKKEVIPTLQLYGSYNYQNKTQSFETNLGISFAPTGNPDTANVYTIFVPTASKFLVHSNFTWSFLPVGTKDNDSLAKKIGLRLDVSFATKNLLYDTTKINKTITSSFLYAKAGVELGIIPKRLSIYGNVNTVSVLDEVDKFQVGTGVNSKFLGYLDCGARLYFDPAPSAKIGDGLFIYSNLNFIINGGDVRRVTKSNDMVIPSIQVGLVKSLDKF